MPHLSMLPFVSPAPVCSDLLCQARSQVVSINRPRPLGHPQGLEMEKADILALLSVRDILKGPPVDGFYLPSALFG